MIKTTVVIDGLAHEVDTIDHNSKLWLVPGWVQSPDGRWKKPARLIRIDNRSWTKDSELHYSLKEKLPSHLFNPESDDWHNIKGYEVIDRPQIVLPLQSASELN